MPNYWIFKLQNIGIWSTRYLFMPLERLSSFLPKINSEKYSWSCESSFLNVISDNGVLNMFFFWSSKAQLSSTWGFQVLAKCTSTRSRSWAQPLKWAPGPCLHTVFVSCTSGSINSFVLPTKLRFQKMASGRAKWYNRVHSNWDY